MMENVKRGAFDFECYEWVNPRCCGLLWKDGWFFVYGKKPTDIAKDTLRMMYTIATNEGVWAWYGHNAGKYDSLFILAAAEDMNWPCQAIITGGRMIQLKVKPPGGKKKWLCINDSMAIVQSSLKDAAKDFHLKSSKLLGEDDYSIDVRKWSEQRLHDGCKADCEVVLELLDTVESLVEEWGGKLKLTFSSIALSIIQARVELQKIPVPENKIARESYVGGRVEVFHHSPSWELTEWDVTSSYPWSMTQSLPWEFKHRVVGERMAERAMIEESAIVFANVTVDDNTYIPSLPWRHDKGGIYFPTGTWNHWFTSVELRHAKKCGVKVRPLFADVYTTRRPFNAFVREVFETKSRAKGAQRSFAKLTLNGGYGKFAQKPERELIEIFSTDEEAFDAIMNSKPNTVRILSEYTPRYIARKQVKWPKHTHYALASFITAHSRILLHKALLQAKGLAYTDTDSIHAASTSVYETGDDLGMLKVEIPSMRGEYFAAKLYRLTTPDKTHHASKGFQVSKETFHQIIKGEEVTTSRMRLAKSMLREEMKLKVTRPEKTRTWAGLSMKRAVLPNGDTRPWNLKELQNNLHRSSVSFHRR